MANIDFFNDLLQTTVQSNASDLHLSTQEPPYIRCQGKLQIVEDLTWEPDALPETWAVLLNEKQRETLARDRSLDLAYHLPEGDRFRLNLYFERDQPAMAVRRINQEILDFETLRLPSCLNRLPEFTHGLVLITGPTGSGKSTTLAAIIDRINRTRSDHIVTVEDPIEQLHQSRMSLVHQRQLYRDVPSFHQGVRDALREDPDIILVGEMRDLETIRAALTAAETGHLVFSTLHTGDAVGAINRILGVFQSGERQQFRQQLSMVLRAVVAQVLVPSCSTGQRIPVVEFLQATPAVAHLIRTGRVDQLYSVMESGRQQGMLTREQSLAEHVHRGRVGLSTAMGLAREARALRDLLELKQQDGLSPVNGVRGSTGGQIVLEERFP